MKNLPNYRYYIICDICGKKIPENKARLVYDRGLTKNLLVCPDDVDQLNPQDKQRPGRHPRKLNPKFVRSEPADSYGTFSTIAGIESGRSEQASGTTPTAPYDLYLDAATSTTIKLRWFGPLDSGQAVISGYKIERETPIGGGFSTINANTQTPAQEYLDTGLSASTQYNYRISAINYNGAGTASLTFAVTTEAA